MLVLHLILLMNGPPNNSERRTHLSSDQSIWFEKMMQNLDLNLSK